MASRDPGARTLTRLRLLSQVTFFAAFLFLLWKTELHGSLRLPSAVRLFLEADPLAGLTNALATRALYRGLLWGLAVLIPTFFLGRFFCGWVCPLGTLNHFCSSLRKRGRKLVESNRYQPWQKLKYAVLVALVVTAALGAQFLMILDPLSLAVRSFVISILPGVPFFSFRPPHFREAFVIGLILAAILALNFRVTRFWCRALCPLGALLGLASRWSVLGLEKRAAQCGDCNRCLLHCQGGDDPIPGAKWRKPECHLCFNCVADCPEGGIAFRFFAGAGTTAAGPNLGRRETLAGLASGAGLLALFRNDAGLAVAPHERRVRPPGALEEERFLARCIRCGECMKACPKNALHPALAEAGVEGLWSPVLVPRIGYCEPSCVLCGDVCPTGAIWEFTPQEKGWTGKNEQPIRLGTAFYDRGRCLPWAMATECIVCEEWCPTSPKAIYLRPAEVADAEGRTRVVRQPYLAPERCVGCGACEFACPVRDRPAVYVTSVGESRSRSNRMLLQPAQKAAEAVSLPESAPGWTKTRQTRAFEAADLWKYVDGDAERYLRAGVLRTLTAEYRWRTVDAVADLHILRDAGGARQVMESEPAAGSQPVAVGDGGRSYGASLTFRKRRYFVRLVAYGDAPLAGLAHAIDSAITESEKPK